MHCLRLVGLLFAICSFGGLECLAQTGVQVEKLRGNYDVQKLERLSKSLQTQQATKIQAAKKAGYQISFETDGGRGEKRIFAELQKLTEDGHPIYYRTFNSTAAKSTRTNFLGTGGGLGQNLNGKGLKIYVWDGGATRPTHKEFQGRLTIADGVVGYNGLGSDHATHVCGTAIAAGIDPSAKGMAPEATAKSFDWNNDLSEAAAEAANGMLVSNHSYGFTVRDRFGNPSLPSSYFGGYLFDARAWDEIMHDAPNFLMVVAAGNDGDDDTANTNPLGGNGQFDKLTGHCVSKNSLVVANAMDVAVDASGSISTAVQIVPSSSEGPTDDLRIKPDIAGNGFEVKSTVHKGAGGNSDAEYEQSGWTGTSMASPNVAGSLLLLQERYEEKSGSFMRAATLKGLALHTTDDAGANGPDAVFGWGLLNARRAVETIEAHGTTSWIVENSLASGQSFTKKIKAKGPVRVSISWTDPPGQIVSETVSNSSTPVLVNDLDLLVSSGGVQQLPWKLTSATSNSRGDNTVDPFERVDISSAGEAEYEVVVSNKGSLQGGVQDYSLIITADDGLSLDGAPVQPGGSTSEVEKLKQELNKIRTDLDSAIERLNSLETPAVQPSLNDKSSGRSVPKPPYGIRNPSATPRLSNR